MHKRTFDHLKIGEIVTIWGGHQHAGKVGKVKNTIGPRTVEVRLADGTVTLADHRIVACGDNSDQRKPLDAH